MVSIKLKFRPSVLEGRPGSFYVQLIHKRKVKRILLPYKIYAAEWDSEREEIRLPASRHSDRYGYLDRVKEELDGILCTLRSVAYGFGGEEDYSLGEVVSLFYARQRQSGLSAFMEHVITGLEGCGKHVTARHYRTVLRTFLLFMGGREIRLGELTPVLVERFERYLADRLSRKNTISFYLRILRAVWRKAIACELIKSGPNPFARVYTGVEKTSKRAVSESVIHELKGLCLPSGQELARDLFLFCYYARGMAFVDLAHLTSDHIKGDLLVYKRHKTGQELRVRLLPEMKGLIRRYKGHAPGKYLFPILKSESPSQKEYDSALRLQNKRLNAIGKRMGIEHLSTYVARHTWASVAKQKGVPVEVISDCMGHTSLTTTHIYIALLDTSRMDYANQIVVRGRKVNEKYFKYGTVP